MQLTSSDSIFRIDSPSAVTIEVFSESGDLRAMGRADSLEHAVDRLDAMPCCRTQEEKLMVRIEDRNHSGCWLYIAPNGTSENWIMSATAKRVRAQVELRKNGVAS